MKNKLINVILIIVAVGLGICSWFLLPEIVAVQIGFDGQISNTLPKLPAILIPLGISVAGAVVNLTGKEKKNTNGYVLLFIGIAVMLLTLFFNC